MNKLNLDENTLVLLYLEWADGRSKASIERQYKVDQAHGKAITHAWRRIGLESERYMKCASCGNRRFTFENC